MEEKRIAVFDSELCTKIPSKQGYARTDSKVAGNALMRGWERFNNASTVPNRHNW
jgi:hypothetical protein